MIATPARHPPRTVPQWPVVRLLLAALLGIACWQAVEHWSMARRHPRYFEMMAAARTMEAATRAIRAEKTARGIMQSAELDPNQTGLIGAEMTAITTTIGDIGSKRTVTNPDFAAALVRLIDTLKIARGTPVVLVVSGSFLGADIAALAAVEALGLRPILVASMSASMFGANDPELTIVDLLTLLRRRGIVRTRVEVAVLGGERGVGEGIETEALARIRASVARDEVEIIDQPPFPGLVDRLVERVDQVLGNARSPGVVINVGGALVGLGSCPQSFEFPPGLSLRPAPCTRGAPGLVMRVANATNAPVLHIINIRRLALDLGLPFDPKPLPEPGVNPAVYGSGTQKTNKALVGGNL